MGIQDILELRRVNCYVSRCGMVWYILLLMCRGFANRRKQIYLLLKGFIMDIFLAYPIFKDNTF